MKAVKKVKSVAFRLTNPGKLVEVELEHKLNVGEVVIRPSLVSVCHADLRYYTAQRRKEALAEKLPMALFHEGIGYVEESQDPSIIVGEKVVIVPNIPRYILEPKSKSECCESCKRDEPDNYCEDGVFLGSGYDGIGQSRLVLPIENVVLVPKSIPDEIAVLSELCSVSLQAISQLSKEDIQKGEIAIFGDGPVGYLTAAILYHGYKIPKERLVVFGAVKEKLQQFDFATQHLIYDFDFKGTEGVTTVIECTGGKFSESAINQAIDLIARKGKLIILGVSEDLVPINTRDILEKGITVIGSSRSTTTDFELLMELLQDIAFQKTLSRLVPGTQFQIKNTNDLKSAMDKVVEEKGWQKSYLSFSWGNEER